MASAVFPAPSSGGGIKSVQRGSAGGAGNVTITAVDLSKSFVNVFGTASSGTVAASGSINSSSGTLASANANLRRSGGGGNNTSTWTITETAALENGNYRWFGAVELPNQSINLNSTSLSGGSNNLVAAVVQGYLASTTTLTVSGACRWEVVEFN